MLFRWTGRRTRWVNANFGKGVGGQAIVCGAIDFMKEIGTFVKVKFMVWFVMFAKVLLVSGESSSTPLSIITSSLLLHEGTSRQRPFSPVIQPQYPLERASEPYRVTTHPAEHMTSDDIHPQSQSLHSFVVPPEYMHMMQ